MTPLISMVHTRYNQGTAGYQGAETPRRRSQARRHTNRKGAIPMKHLYLLGLLAVLSLTLVTYGSEDTSLAETETALSAFTNCSA